MREGVVDPWSGQRAAIPEDSNPETAQVREYLSRTRQEARLIDFASNEHGYEDVHDYNVPSVIDYGSPVDVGQATNDQSRNIDKGNQRISPQDPKNLSQGRRSILKKEEDEDPKPNSHIEEARQVEQSKQIEETKQVEQIKLLTVGLLKPPLDISGSSLQELFLSAHKELRDSEPQHPSECTSLATWKAYASQNPPIILSHSNLFRMYKYLTKWMFAVNVYYIWAWALLLQTPLLLSGDELAQLREVCRAIAKSLKSQSERLISPENQVESDTLGKACIQIVVQIWGQHDLNELLV